MELIILAAVLLIAMLVWAYWHKIQMLRTPKLTGVRGGVWIRMPGGQRVNAQTWLEQELAQRGMELFDLSRESVETLQRDGIWSRAIAAQDIDVAIIGYYHENDGYYALNLRFYGPYGEIIGAFADSTEGEVQLQLIPKVVSTLARCYYGKNRQRPEPDIRLR